MNLPASLADLATPAGVERVYGVDGSHGSCASYALPHDLADVRVEVQKELDAAWEATTGKSSWRRAHKAPGASVVEVIDLYDPAEVAVPGFDRDRVPPGTRTVLVVTEMYRPATAPVLGLFHRLARRRPSR